MDLALSREINRQGQRNRAIESVYKQATGLTKINENRYFVGLASWFVLNILTASPPPRDQACHLYMVSVMAKYICMQKDLLDHVGEHISKYFLISYKFDRRIDIFNSIL